MDLTFRDAVAPLQREPGRDGHQVALQPTREAGQLIDAAVGRPPPSTPQDRCPGAPGTSPETLESVHEPARCTHPPDRASPEASARQRTASWPETPWRATPRARMALEGRGTASPAPLAHVPLRRHAVAA